jgi:hypothetical protein
MNTQTKLIFTAIIAVSAMLVLAPALTIGAVDAKKSESCTNGNSDHECSGNSDEGAGAKKTCQAGSKGQTHPNCP